LTVLVRTIPRNPEAEQYADMARQSLAAEVPDLNIRMDEKNIYVEVGRFELSDRESAQKRLKEVQEHEMYGQKPFADAKLTTVGLPAQENGETEEDTDADEEKKNEKQEKPGDIEQH
jgi:hypothetical protein